MQVIARSTLRAFWEKHSRAKNPLSAWCKITEKAVWTAPADVKAMFGTGVDFVGDNRAIFDVGGNKYRVVAHIAYDYRRVLIKFVGTHAEYDKMDAETI